ncbi:MAG: toxin-antitoxin system TumE family protein [bacterium]
MNNPLRTIEDYELFLYTRREQFTSVRRSTVTLVRMGASLARVSGELHFDQDLRLMVRERVLYHRLPAIIDWHGYEVWRGTEKLYWYDSQPHPNDPALQSTHPHHKHIPPNIKHNRIPAPEMSFVKPNLSALIREMEAIITKNGSESEPN